MKNLLFVSSSALVVIAFALLISFTISKRYKSDLSVNGCKIGGCNGEICQEADEETIASICIYDPKYDCYKSAVCEKQAGGNCGWTRTEEFTKCLESYTNNSQDSSPQAHFCGGIAGISCPEGYKCKLEGNYPDAGGVCVKI